MEQQKVKISLTESITIGCIVGVLIGAAGFTISMWQFWILAVIMNILGQEIYKSYKRKKMNNERDFS